MIWVGAILSGVLAAAPPDRLVTPRVEIVPLHTTMAEVESALGEARACGHAAEGEASPLVKCFVLKAGVGEAYLLVESDASGGYGETVTGFDLRAESPEGLKGEGEESVSPASELCEPVDLPVGAVRLAGRLGLGMSRERALEVMGRPTRTEGSTLAYRTGKGDVTGRVEIETRRGRITRIRAYRSDIQ